MRRRDISRVLLLSATGIAVAPGQTRAQSSCTQSCYPLVLEEQNAGVTSSNDVYPPGDIRRYHAGGSDWTIALGQLRDVAVQGVACFIPKGTFVSTPAATGLDAIGGLG